MFTNRKLTGLRETIKSFSKKYLYKSRRVLKEVVASWGMQKRLHMKKEATINYLLSPRPGQVFLHDHLGISF